VQAGRDLPREDGQGAWLPQHRSRPGETSATQRTDAYCHAIQKIPAGNATSHPEFAVTFFVAHGRVCCYKFAFNRELTSVAVSELLGIATENDQVS